MKIDYIIYDERYLTDPDSATCYEVCDTLNEARNSGPDYGGHVIVKTTSQKVGKRTYEVIKEEIAWARWTETI
jgi:hypothetical protein